MATRRLHHLSHFLFPLFFICAIFCYVASASSPPVASPAAEAQLICHTDNPAECYPKVFSPTEEFQIIHDDQDLPPGLHVQLDVQTGQKQAKLYNPDEENPALAGLPVDQGVIVVDPEPPSDSGPRIPAGAPAYEPAGVVKAPQEKNEGFTQALLAIKGGSESIDSVEVGALNEALGLLDELSHDLYYGLQIAEDSEVVQSLFCLMFGRAQAHADGQPFPEEVSFLASSVLSAAVGNNARALAAIENSWDDITEKQCRGGSQSIRHELFHRLAPTSELGTKQESEEIENIRLHLTVINGLLKAPKIRTKFLEDDGIQNFLRILLRDGSAWESRKAKVAQITSDTFLDEDFGATLGLWPRTPQVDGDLCAGSGPESFGDECWGYHMEKISQAPGAPEWSSRLLSFVQQAQTPYSKSEAPPTHKEL